MNDYTDNQKKENSLSENRNMRDGDTRVGNIEQRARRKGESGGTPTKADPVNYITPQESRPGDIDWDKTQQIARSSFTKKTSVEIELEKIEESHKKETSVEHRYTKIPAIKFLNESIVQLGALTVLALIFFWVVPSVLALITDISALPKWMSYISFAFLLGATGLVIYVTFRAVNGYLKLKKEPQIEIEQYLFDTSIKPQDRDFLKETCQARLSNVLRDSELDTYKRTLRDVGFSNEEIIKYLKDAENLNARRGIDFKTWWTEYVENIINPVDRKVKDHIVLVRNRVGVKTALCPFKALDLMIVLYHNFQLLRRLCRLAGRRSDTLGSLSIFLHVIMGAYVAYRMEEVTESTADNVTQLHDKLAEEFGEAAKITVDSGKNADGNGAAAAGSEMAAGAAGSIAADAFKSLSAKLAPKIGEGIANGLLTYRIGTHTWNLVKPISVK